MSLYTQPTFVGHFIASVARKRAVARLVDQLERATDRRLADLGIARADIAGVALAAYPSPALAAADLRRRSPLFFSGAAAHG